jgi:hypothetical protein
MLLNSQFSSNYFSISQVEQNFDDFADYFKGEGEGVGQEGSSGRMWVSTCVLCSRQGLSLENGRPLGRDWPARLCVYVSSPQGLTAQRCRSCCLLPCLPADLGELPGSDAFWRFNRTKDYAYKGENETVEQLKATFG